MMWRWIYAARCCNPTNIGRATRRFSANSPLSWPTKFLLEPLRWGFRTSMHCLLSWIRPSSRTTSETASRRRDLHLSHCTPMMPAVWLHSFASLSFDALQNSVLSMRRQDRPRRPSVRPAALTTHASRSVRRLCLKRLQFGPRPQLAHRVAGHLAVLAVRPRRRLPVTHLPRPLPDGRLPRLRAVLEA